jgi:two-component system CAI-1 autoinducer sensor kinase/phosphatase CqsS
MLSTGRLFKQINDLLTENYFFIRQNLTFIGWLAFFAHPGFYFIWQYYKQPYESVILRSLGSIFSLILVYRDHFPRILQPHFPKYWFLYVTYTLPFFHTFNFLENGFNPMWMMSTIIASLLVVVLLEITIALLSFIIGCSAAFGLFWYLNNNFDLPPLQDYFIPVLIYAVITGIVIHRRETSILAERNQASLSIASKIAHEIRTPLMTIQAAAMALENPFSRNDKAIATDIDAASTDVLKTIDMVLTLSKNPKTATQKFIPLDINKGIESSLERYPFLSEEEREMVTFRKNTGTKAAIVKGDESLIYHIVLNLLKNALFFAKKGGGHVEITTRCTKKKIEIQVSDDGPGVPALMQINIFDQYVTTNSHSGGSGLGLSFVKMAIRTMDGNIRLSNKKGWPTTFIVILPTATGIDVS